jgi:hypothetical protein
VVVFAGGIYKLIDFGKGMRGDDVDRGEFGGEGLVFVLHVGGERMVDGKARKEEDQEDQAVFATVVGEGYFF